MQNWRRVAHLRPVALAHGYPTQSSTSHGSVYSSPIVLGVGTKWGPHVEPSIHISARRAVLRTTSTTS